MAGKKNPGALTGATGVGLTFKAYELSVTSIPTTFYGEMHHAKRLERLRIRHGLHGLIAVAIAPLAYDGGQI